MQPQFRAEVRGEIFNRALKVLGKVVEGVGSGGRQGFCRVFEAIYRTLWMGVFEEKEFEGKGMEVVLGGSQEFLEQQMETGGEVKVEEFYALMMEWFHWSLVLGCGGQGDEDLVNRVSKEFNYSLLVFLEGAIAEFSEAKKVNPVLPVHLQQMLSMLFGFTPEHFTTYKKLTSVWNFISEKLENKAQESYLSEAYLERILLQTRYWAITSLVHFNDTSKVTLSEINIPLLFSKHENLKHQLSKSLNLLCKPFSTFKITFDHMNFKEHLGAISDLSRQTTLLPLKNLPKSSLSQYLYNFHFLSNLLIPLWEFYSFYSQQIVCSLLKFCYLVLLSDEAARRPMNLYSHLVELGRVYYEAGRSSVKMQMNFLYCAQFIQNYAETNKLELGSHLDLIDGFLKTDHEMAVSSEVFEWVCKLGVRLSEAKKKDRLTLAEWKALATVQKLRAYFLWVLPTEKWLTDERVEGDVSYNTGFHELINAMGIFENLCGVQLNQFPSDQERVCKKLTAISQMVAEWNNSVFRETIKASKLLDDKSTTVSYLSTGFKENFRSDQTSPFSLLSKFVETAHLITKVGEINGTGNGSMVNTEAILKNLLWISFHWGDIHGYTKTLRKLANFFQKSNFETPPTHDHTSETPSISTSRSTTFIIPKTSKPPKPTDNLPNSTSVLALTQKCLSHLYPHPQPTPHSLAHLLPLLSSEYPLFSSLHNLLLYPLLTLFTLQPPTPAELKSYYKTYCNLLPQYVSFQLFSAPAPVLSQLRFLKAPYKLKEILSVTKEWVEYVEENLPRVRREIILNSMQQLKSVYAKGSGMKEYLVRDRSYMQLAMAADFKVARFLDGYVSEQYGQQVPRRTSVYTDDRKDLYQQMGIQWDTCKVVYLRSGSGSLELGVMYVRKKGRFEVEVQQGLYLETGSRIKEVVEEFNCIFEEYHQMSLNLSSKNANGDASRSAFVGEKLKEFHKKSKNFDKRLGALSEKFTKQVLKEYRILLTGDFKNNKVNKVVLGYVNAIVKLLQDNQEDRDENDPINDQNEIYRLKLVLMSVLINYIVIAGRVDKPLLTKTLKTMLSLFTLYNPGKDENLLEEITSLATEWKEHILETYSNSDLSREIVYLLLQPELSNFPFEYIDAGLLPYSSSVVAESQQYFLRIPNIEVISSYLGVNKSVPQLKNMQKFYFLVNPQGDLKSTEKKFKKMWGRYPTWKGEFGKKPESESEFFSEVKRSEMYLYCGHGYGGDIFIPMRLARQKIKAGWLLFGCKSCGHTYNGGYEMTNHFMYFFTAGWPFVAGWLWDVMDKDIDRYSEAFLETWFKETQKELEQLQSNPASSSTTIQEHIVKSRMQAVNVCKYKYLNGHSLAFYGMPLVLFK